MTFAVAGLMACAPALDWRDVRPAGSRLQLLFPCKPTAQERRVALAGPPVALALHACTAGGMTWGLSHVDVVNAGRVAPALAELRAAAAANLGATAGPLLPLPVTGATPNAASGHMRLVGRLPDGTAVQMQVLLFAHGTQVFQATVLGLPLPEEAAENFFASIRFGR